MRVKYQSFTSSDDEVDGVDEQKLRKLVVVGDGGCGKTCLLTVFKTGEFPEQYFPTVFETSVVDVDICGRSIALEMWDTAGQEDYDRLRPLFYPDTDVILLCFSLVHRDSFSNVIDRWLPELKYFCPGVPIVLVGNKSDLRSDLSFIDSLTKKATCPISAAEGLEVARRIGARAYVECSARKQSAVGEVFRTAALAAMQRHNHGHAQCRLL